ncbi:ferredoxin [Streptomyces sp. ASQP_92]|uniref:ferredoxin n=1 Tax=unclassified Streptomyces TaxID=2593676 RepID=UPI0021BE0348|nr:ferredoxin [Streptomyces sp. ASQP_92]MCT9088809.1 ferredoxin [Streptomyces sp. ASQP_92]
MTWTVRVDPSLCLASGMCAGAAPEVFALDTEHARVLVDTLGPDERLLDIADACPAQAITVHDANGVIGPRRD